jgi:CBS domain containing-hemolysin-like protein
MPTSALVFAITICSIVLCRLFYVALASTGQYRAARRVNKVAEFSGRVEWPGSGKGHRILEVPIGNRLRRHPSPQGTEYPFAERRRA